MANTMDSNSVDPVRLTGGVPKATTTQLIERHFSDGIWHVHLHGPPGFGKRDALKGLSAPAGGIKQVDLSAQDWANGRCIRQLTEGLGVDAYRLVKWPSHDLAAEWSRLMELLALRSERGRVLFVLEHAELLLADPEFAWPEGIEAYADFLTVSIAPLHLLTGSHRKIETQRSIALGPFPAGVAGADDFLSSAVTEQRWNAQDLGAFEQDGRSWFDAFLAGRPEIDGALRRKLEAAFEGKHVGRQYEIWEGHPFLDTALLEHLLETIIGDGNGRDTIQDFNNALGRMQGDPNGTLAKRLLVTDTEDVAQSAVLLRGISHAILDCCADKTELEPDIFEWGYASGLVTARNPDERDARTWKWTRIATLFDSDPTSTSGRGALNTYALDLANAAKWRDAIREDAAREADETFEDIRFLVELAYCDTEHGKALDRQIDLHPMRTKPVFEGVMYRFSLTYYPLDQRDREKCDPSRITLLVFEVEQDNSDPIGINLLNHHVRALSLLGRQHHPALPAFRRGGTLSSDADLTRPRPYIEIEEPGEPLLRGGSTSDFEHLRSSGVIESNSTRGGPSDAFIEVTLLAEALTLIHQAGMIHRSLDFNALLRKPNGSLVISGFEKSVLLRSALAGEFMDQLAIYNAKVEDLACRARQVFDDTTGLTIDSSVDVYSFGALATMILTGLPSPDVSQATWDAIPPQQDQQQNAEQREEWLDRVFELLNNDLVSRQRWQGLGAHSGDVKELLGQCLSPHSRERPSMETVSARLQYLSATMKRESVLGTDALAVSYNPKIMGEMIRNLKPALIPEDTDLETLDGRAVLQGYIRTWLKGTRWLHYSKFGFPHRGATRADKNRLESKYVLAGGPVVFYASPYDAGDGLGPRMEWLWLGYALHAGQANLPMHDPVDDPRFERTTDEPPSWLELPGNIVAHPVSEIANEAAQSTFTSWQAVTDELKRVADTSAMSLLGREAGTSWKVHRDYHRAMERLREFPAIAVKEGGGTFTLMLDVEEFHKENRFGELAFYRQVIMEGKDPRAFFEEQLTTEIDGESGAGEWLRLRRRGVRSRVKALNARVIGPSGDQAGEGEVRIRLERESETAIVPRKVRVRLTSSYGTIVALERQNMAIERLLRKKTMMAALVNPRKGTGLKPMLSDACGRSVVSEGRDLEELRDRVQTLLGSAPLTAVQGPPGTGKTTLQAATIDEILRWRDGTRLLITSQSHAATDNILLSVISMLEEQAKLTHSSPMIDAIRLFSSSAEDRVDPIVRQRFSVDARVRDLRNRIREAIKATFSENNPDLARAATAARDVTYSELRDRIESSAPLVFATTGASADAFELLPERMLNFDIAMIDEAAKAWALDLVIPMSISDQVIVVGDPEQLPPFGEMELTEFLRTAQGRKGRSDIPFEVDYLLGTAAQDEGDSPFQRMNAWLKPFHRILEVAKPNERGEKIGGIPVTQMLTRQFRSVDAIGNIVSNTFYRGEIVSQGPAPDPDRRIAISANGVPDDWRPGVVWVDTSKGEREEFDQRNAGGGRLINLGEIRVVRALFDRQMPSDESEPWKRMRILSPYKAQVQRIEGQYMQNPGFLGVENRLVPKIVMTADSSQGSEADIVGISLCRRSAAAMDRHLAVTESFLDNDEFRPDQVEKLERAVREIVGFLVSPERLNVISSRARQQLIFVGDIDYYRDASKLIEALAKARRYRSDHLLRRQFWGRLLGAFTPYDPNIHNSAAGLETPVIISAASVLEAREDA